MTAADSSPPVLGLAAIVVFLALPLFVTSPAAANSPLGAAIAAEPATLRPPEPCPGCWHPTPTTDPWQLQLQGAIRLSVEASVFDVDGLDVPASVVGELHAGGRRAVCYVDAGTFEPFREDSSEFPKRVLGNPVGGFEEERWLDIRRLGVLKPIIRARLDVCAEKGFDAADPDNLDGYQNRTGFPLNGRDQLRFNAWVANAAHERGLAVGLKNDLGQIEELVPYFDFAVNEQCFQYDECGRLRPFIDAGKAVFGVEYSLPLTEFCDEAARRSYSTIKKRLSLKSSRATCG